MPTLRLCRCSAGMCWAGGLTARQGRHNRRWLRARLALHDWRGASGMDERRRGMVGPLTPFWLGFRAELTRLGFASWSTDTQLSLMADLTRWLDRQLNPPGFAGDSVSWEGWGHVEKIWELPEGAAGPCCSDGGGGSVGACFGVGGH